MESSPKTYRVRVDFLGKLPEGDTSYVISYSLLGEMLPVAFDFESVENVTVSVYDGLLKVDPKPLYTEEEFEAAKARWKEVMKNPGPAKLLLEPGEQIPDGWTGQVEWRVPLVDPPVEWSKMGELPDGSIIMGGPGLKPVPITGWEDVIKWQPPGDEGSTFGTSLRDKLLEASKMSYTIPVSVELYEEFADSGKAIMEYLMNPQPRPEPEPVQPSRRERWQEWIDSRRMRLADRLYRVLSGEDIDDRIQRRVDDYF